MSKYKANLLTLDKFYSAISNSHNVWESTINSDYTHYKFISPDDYDTFEYNVETNIKSLQDSNWVDQNKNIIDIDYKINKQGFRCNHFSDEEGILFLGCSYTFGVGLHEHQTWAYKVADYFKTNCWNLGIPGHGFDIHSYFVNCYLKDELPNIKAVCMLQNPPDRISLLQDIGDEIVLQDYFTILQANEDKAHTIMYKDFLQSLEMTYEMHNLKNRKSIENYCKLHGIPFVYMQIKSALKDFSMKPSVARDCQHHGETENTHIANKVIEKLDKY